MAVSDARSPHPADHPGPFVLVDDLDAPALREADLHHLTRVLRLRAGDPVVLGDGAGSWRPGALGDQVDPTGPIEAVPPPVPSIAVGFALVKGGKPELVVQKLTELGVDRIVPFRAARSVVQWDEGRSAKAHTRFTAVARAATMQCHRPWLPSIDAVATFEDLLAEAGVALADRSGGRLAPSHRLVLVGPEGGWAPEELAAASAAGAGRVRVAPHVLRAETAALTVGALLADLRVADRPADAPYGS